MLQHTSQLSLTQLVAIAVSTIVIVFLPNMALLAALFIGITMTFSMTQALAVGYYYSSKQIHELSNQHASQLGTHFGGIICYLVILNSAFEYIQ